MIPKSLIIASIITLAVCVPVMVWAACTNNVTVIYLITLPILPAVAVLNQILLNKFLPMN